MSSELAWIEYSDDTNCILQLPVFDDIRTFFKLTKVDERITLKEVSVTFSTPQTIRIIIEKVDQACHFRKITRFC